MVSGGCTFGNISEVKYDYGPEDQMGQDLRVTRLWGSTSENGNTAHERLDANKRGDYR